MKKSKKFLCSGLAALMLVGMSAIPENIEIVNPTEASASYQPKKRHTQINMKGAGKITLKETETAPVVISLPKSNKDKVTIENNVANPAVKSPSDIISAAVSNTLKNISSNKNITTVKPDSSNVVITTTAATVKLDSSEIIITSSNIAIKKPTADENTETPDTPALTENNKLSLSLKINNETKNSMLNTVDMSHFTESGLPKPLNIEQSSGNLKQDFNESVNAKMLEQINKGAASTGIIKPVETLTETTTELTDCQENTVPITDSYNSVKPLADPILSVEISDDSFVSLEVPLDSSVIIADSISSTDTISDINSISLKDLTDMAANLNQNDFINPVNPDSYGYDEVYLDMNYGVPYIHDINNFLDN